MSVTTGRWARAGPAAAAAAVTQAVRTDQAAGRQPARGSWQARLVIAAPLSMARLGAPARLPRAGGVHDEQAAAFACSPAACAAEELVGEPARWAQREGLAAQREAQAARGHAQRRRHRAGRARRSRRADPPGWPGRDRSALPMRVMREPRPRWPRRARRGAGRPAAGGWRCCAPAGRGPGPRGS